MATGARNGIAAVRGSEVGPGEAPVPAVPTAWACVIAARRARGAGRADVRCRAWGRTRPKPQRVDLRRPEARSSQGNAAPAPRPSGAAIVRGVPGGALTCLEPARAVGQGLGLVRRETEWSERLPVHGCAGCEA